MKRSELLHQIRSKESFLCVGLDTDIHRIPTKFKTEKDPILAFNKAVIDATLPYTIAYKPNVAFYEMLGPGGWDTLQATLEYLPNEVLTIADAKRGDIGNTASYYAKTFYETFLFDALTVAPYMGEDSVKPFIRENKWAIVLALTSNSGSRDFQNQQLANGKWLFEEVLEKVASWGNPDNTMFVVGATNAKYFHRIRKIIPDHFILVPGIGAQGGSLNLVCQNGMNKEVGLIVNASRSIIYAGSNEGFSTDVANAARSIQQNMQEQLQRMR
jgi:orotidine-5'-phosphate decarboxylase